MKYLLIVLFLILAQNSFSQSKQDVKKPIEVLTRRQVDSLINVAPHPDSAFISMKHLNEVLAKIRKEWNMETGEPATQALQMVLNTAFADLKKRRAEFYKKQ